MATPAPDLKFSCRCGTVKGHMKVAAISHGLRLICHCADCRAAERYFAPQGHSPSETGVDLYQTYPDLVQIDQGKEHLALLRLSPRGLMRWHASCCGTPLANTLAKPQLPFVGLCVNTLEDPAPLGRVKAEGFVPARTPGQPPKHKGGARIVYGVLSRMITARATGRWRTSAFFDTDSGAPRAEPVILSKTERAALYDR